MSADDNAPEQAREVEVVARAIDSKAVDAAARVLARYWHDDPLEPVDREVACAALAAALPHLREAGESDSVREALLAAADAVERERSAAWGLEKGKPGFSHGLLRAVNVLRARADDLTGRSWT